MKRAIALVVILVSIFSTGLLLALDSWPKGAPTPEQLKEFFFQIEKGVITKETLGHFLGDNQGVEFRAYEAARRILGHDLITPEEVTIARHVFYSSLQLDYFKKSMPSEALLRWAKENNYVLMAGPPQSMSFPAIHALNPALFGWYNKESFSHDGEVKPVWLMIRKEYVANSTSHNWDEQVKLLTPSERVPNVGEVAWLATTYYAVRGMRLLKKIYVRTSSLTSQNDHIMIGYFDSQGLSVVSDPGGYGRYIGITTARK